MFKAPFRRAFSLTLAARKNKDQLKQLGNFLQKGKVAAADGKIVPVHAKPSAPDSAEMSALDECVDRKLDELDDSFATVAYMDKNDIKIQENFDEGRQFGAYPLLHFFNRKAVIRSLPDEIDLLETPWEEVQRVYAELQKLDDDQAVHSKYMKKYGIGHNDLIMRFRIGRNLYDLCKTGRRGEKYELPKALDRVFKNLYQYDVIGFDRSIVGVPLRAAKGAADAFPPELIRDIKPFLTKVPVHKVDVNSMDDDLKRECITPYDPKPLPAEEVLRDVGKPLFLDNIDDYQRFEHPLADLVSQLEKAVLQLRDQLYLEITQKTMHSGLGFVSFNSPRIKLSEYVLVLKNHDSSTATGPMTSYRFKFFDLVPVHGLLLTSIKHHNCLYKHFFKVILINLDEHIDVLMRVKYKLPDEAQTFIRRLYGQINRVIKLKMLPMTHRHRMRVSLQFDSVLYKPMTHTNFLRIYWLRRPGRSGTRDPLKKLRRQLLKLNLLRLNLAKLLW